MLSNEVLHEAYRLVTNVNEGILEQRNEKLMDFMIAILGLIWELKKCVRFLLTVCSSNYFRIIKP